MSPILALFVLVATATYSGVNTFAEGQPGVYEPLRFSHSDHGLSVIDSDTQLSSAEVSTSVDATLDSGKDEKQHILTEKREHVSLHMGIQDGSDGDMLQRHVTLVIAVPSVRPDRRKAIRETWSKWVDDRVILRFFTEPPNKGAGGKTAEKVAVLLEEELMTHGDIVLQDIGTGMNFGLKLLWAMRWMSYHYTFDFFLRLDDDYFLCLEQLLEDLNCLLSRGKQQSPIFAGHRVCNHKRNVMYVDEAYLLFSSSIIDRILATSGLKCSGYGSHTAAAWMRVGGPGNPRGDVAIVHDYRLDHYGKWWKDVKTAKVARSEKNPICEQGLGAHHIYPKDMKKIWIGESGRTNATNSTEDCQSLFRYEDDGKCLSLSHAAEDVFLRRDNFQPCDSFSAEGNEVWCGHQGC